MPASWRAARRRPDRRRCGGVPAPRLSFSAFRRNGSRQRLQGRSLSGRDRGRARVRAAAADGMNSVSGLGSRGMENLRWEKSCCPYCGVGCGLRVGIRDGALVKIKGDPDHPANFGEICAKAAHLIPTVRPADRALYPMVRDKRGGELRRTSWPGALSYVARHFKRIIARHGSNAIGFYGSGQLTTESYYVFNKLAKGFLGTNNFDTNSRLCMSSAVSAYTLALGSDGPAACYEDIELADLFLIAGSNTAWCHPITFRRIEKRKLAARDGRAAPPARRPHPGWSAARVSALCGLLPERGVPYSGPERSAGRSVVG